MNNQAAQTMPELPAPYSTATGFALFNSAQVHQYARDYAAALSQTAGVPDRKTLFEQAEVLAACYRLKELVEGVGCERWQNANGLRLKDTQQWVEFYSVVTRMQRLEYPTPAAPAASGGEDDGDEAPQPTEMQIRYAEGYSDGVRDTERIAKERDSNSPAGASQSSNPNPVTPGLSSESGASVSERARELVTSLYGDKAVFTRHDMARALEQALTQQRGECYCLDCKGSGEVIGLHASPSGDPQDDYEAPTACPKCDGTGDAK